MSSVFTQRRLQLGILIGVLFAIMFPATFTNAVHVESQLVERDELELTEIAAQNINQSLPDEAADSLPATDDQKKSCRDRAGQENSRNNGPTITVESGSSTGNNASDNRSVVGWQSGSISDFSPNVRNNPIGLRIPSISLDARVNGVGVDEDNAMIIPDRRNTVGWYKHGPTPGDTGSAVMAGHLDDERGRSVFFNLRRVEVGDEILVDMEDGSQIAFEVFEKSRYDADDIPADRVFDRTGEPVLTLITCAGRFDWNRMQYTESLIVYATPVES